MANIKISELNGLTKKAYDDLVPIVDVSANETKKVSIEELIDNNVSLLAVSGTAPSQCSAGDKYYNTTTNKIYTATDTNTWGTIGEDAKEGIMYVVFEKQDTYAYDGTELVSVGGGSGGETLPVGAIVDYDGTDIPVGWEEVNDYSTDEIDTGKKWIDGKNIYRKVITSILNGTYTESGVRYTWIILNPSNINITKTNFVAALSDRTLTNIESSYITSIDYITSGGNANKIQIGSNVSNIPINQQITLILEYTKTTD